LAAPAAIASGQQRVVFLEELGRFPRLQVHLVERAHILDRFRLACSVEDDARARL